MLREFRDATIPSWKLELAQFADPPAKFHALADLYIRSTREHGVECHILQRSLIECAGDAELQALLRDFYLEFETLLAGLIAEGQQSGVFRRSLEPRVGAWELIRSALGYSLTAPLGVPLYNEGDYAQRAIECLLHGLLKTDV